MIKIRTAVALLMLLAPLLAAILVCHDKSIISTDLRDLMPEYGRPDQQTDLTDILSSKIIFTTAVDPERLIKKLEKIPDLEVFGRPDLKNFFFKYRYNLIPVITDPAELENMVTEALYNPFAGVTDFEIAHDPFLTMRRLAVKYAASLSHGSDSDGCLKLQNEKENSRICIVTAEFHQDKTAASDLNRTIRKLAEEDPTLRYTGEVFFSAHAAESSEKDMMRIGFVSTLIFSALFIYVFRSAKILLLTCLSLALTLADGIAAVLLVFGEIHVITLALGTCLIGICVDYNLHVFMKRAHGDDPENTVRSLAGPMLLSLISSISAYLVMSFTDLCVLKQLSVMAVASLAASFLTVMCLLVHFRVKTVSEYGGRIPARPGRIAVTALTSAVTVLGVALYAAVPADDDVGRMQERDGNLVRMNKEIEKILNGSDAGVWYAAGSSSLEKALKECEELYQSLTAKERNKILLPCTFIPSADRQRENIESYGTMTRQLKEIYKKSGIETAMPDFSTMSIFRPQEHPLYRLLPVGENGILIRAPASDPALLSKLDGMSFLTRMDRRSEWSNTFRHYRIQLSWLLGISFCIISLYMLLKAGRKAVNLFILPAASGISAGIVANVLLGGGYMNMFTVMAGFMILGLGTDYSIFYHSFSGNERDKGRTVQTLITAWLTTETSFGMLAFSGISVISSFGLNLAAGLTVMLLAILFSGTGEEKKEKEKQK
jgi:predicted exporter